MRLVNDDTGEEVQQLVELARRFPDNYIETKDRQSYVAHHVVGQRLLSVVGPYDYELVQVLRGDVPAVPPDPSGQSRRAKAGTPALHQAVTGAVWRLTCEVDGRRTQVEEVGDTDPNNWPTDGARLKDAASDALKRCAMRLGLGLHLWAGDLYFLDKQLAPPLAPKRDPAKEQLDRLSGRGLVDPQSPAWADKDGRQ
jgi:hypothetical protein